MVDEERKHIINRNSFIGIAVNVALALIKVTIGLVSGSLAIISDGLNNASDTLSSLITVLGYRLAKKKPTHSHPLGFGRMEYISALVVAFIVLYVGFSLLFSSARKIFHPEDVHVSPIMLAVIILTVFLKLFLWRFNIKSGKKIDSEALILSGTDALTDALSSIVTVISVILSYFSSFNFDSVAGMIVSLFVLYAGFSSLSGTVSSIVGERPKRETVNELRRIIASHKPLKGGYDIQIHSYGPERSVGTCNVEAPSDASAEEVFDAMTEAQIEILDRMGIYFTFGLYAVNDKNPQVILMKNEVLKTLKSVSESVISIHAFHIHFENYSVHFDVVCSFSLTDISKFRKEADSALKKEFPGYTFQYNIDPDYAD